MPQFLETARREFRKYKQMADRAIAQAPPGAFFATLDPESNSLALIAKHLAGNMHSRWTDFLTTDGDKPDRDRDSEFETAGGDTREFLMARWEAGWKLLFDALEPLEERDLERTVLIRGEPHTVLEAITRQLTHYGYHIGQVVFLSKHLGGAGLGVAQHPEGKIARI